MVAQQTNHPGGRNIEKAPTLVREQGAFKMKKFIYVFNSLTRIPY